jgi:hypothetical protein
VVALVEPVIQVVEAPMDLVEPVTQVMEAPMDLVELVTQVVEAGVQYRMRVHALMSPNSSRTCAASPPPWEPISVWRGGVVVDEDVSSKGNG